MSVPQAVLHKVKLLLNLAQSSNQNEADNARTMADKLIAKHNITEDDIASLDEKVYYGEDEKLFVTLGIVGWRQQLALAIATYFDCQIVQEELVPGEGVHQFNYFVYGDTDQVKDTQFVYHAFSNKVELLSDTQCLGRGPIYIDSYCEGVVESVRYNIQMYGIDIPEIKSTLNKEQHAPAPTTKSLAKSKEEKDEPTDKRVDVNSQSLIKDVMAYFKGVDDGKNLSLQDVLAMAVEAQRIPEIEAHPVGE
jgi:hypothetical protein